MNIIKLSGQSEKNLGRAAAPLNRFTPANVQMPLYPLTSSQREIWFDQMLHADIPLYNIGGYVKIPGPIDQRLFEQAVNLLVRKHDALRTVLQEERDEDGVPLQAFPEELRVTAPVHDFSAADSPHEAALAWMQERFEQPFALAGQPLFRYDLLRLADDQWYWLLQYHHLIIDGWGVALVNRSLAEIYTGLAEGRVPELDGASYIDFIEDDRRYIESPTFEKNRQYWLEQYRNIPEPLFAPRHHASFSSRTAGSGCETLHLDRAFYGQLEELAQKHGATVFHVLLGALYVYFTRTGQRDCLPVGLPVLNRSNASFRQTAGLFVGVSTVLFDFGRKLSFGELLRRIAGTLRAGYRHQRCPVSEISRTAGLDRERARLFDVSLSYENHDNDLSFNGATGHLMPLLHGHELLPLMIFVREFHARQDVECNFVYNLAFFNAEEIQALQARFVNILKSVQQQDAVSVRRLPLLTEEETEQLTAWNDTAADYPADKTLADMFEEQAAKTPENIAVVFEERRLTYRQLNEKANQLAHVLIELGVRADTLVAICAERSLEMIAGLLGILKAGGAYVPLDPDYPEERLRFMLQDCGAHILLTQTHLHERLPGFGGTVLDLDDQALYAGRSAENPQRCCGPEHLAYVIYTSGSTGRPKGCMMMHRNAARLFAATEAWYRFDSSDVWTMFHSYAFDFSVWEIWGALLFGGKLVMVPYLISRSPDEFLDLLIEHQVTVLNQTPSAFRQLIAADAGRSDAYALKWVIFGGEALELRALEPWFAKHGDRQPQLINMYGITETTVHVTFYPLDTLRMQQAGSIVGRPIPDLQAYILDYYNHPLPPGIPGELCIAGAGLARGYLNRPDLTAEKFVEVEIFGRTERIYRTGDLARWRADGNQEYLGRIDHQVKLRGFRIELGEIEAALTRHEAVSEAVAVLREREGNKSLAAYVTPAGNAPADAAALRAFLKERLPDWMVPASFTVLDKMPLTPNGKIDRKALPEPDAGEISGEAPLRTETEKLLAGLYSALLGSGVNSASAHFFELGGHSLLAARLASRIRDSFSVEMPLRILFEHPAVAELAAWLDRQRRGDVLPSVEPQPEGAPLMLSFAQERLRFLARLEGPSATYNMPAALRLRGGLKIEALRRTFIHLTERHQSLRICFPETEAAVDILPPYDPLAVTDLADLSGNEQAAAARERIQEHAVRPFDLETGPLLRLHLLILGGEEHVLLFNMHHIISDGWSMGILLREWTEIYTALAEEREPELHPLPIQYSDYAAWQRRVLNEDVMERQLARQAEELTGAPQLLELPTDHPRPPVQSYRGAHLESRVGSDLTARLHELGMEKNSTLFMTLLAAFNVLLHRCSGQDEHVLLRPARPNAPHRPGCLRASGSSLRAAGGAARAGAQPQPQPALPGHVRAPEQ